MNMQKIRMKVPVGKGFTLIEIMFAVFLISVAVASLVVANGAFTQANGAGLDMSTAEFLNEQMREMTMETAYDDLAILNNMTYSPPIDVAGNSMTEFSSFSQQVIVENVNDSTLDTSPTVNPDFTRVTVSILKNNRTLSSTSWIRTRH